MATPIRIGVLRGMETTFPDALISHLNSDHDGVEAEYIQLDAVRMDDPPGYDAILDRISHEVPFYRSYLKWAALKGTYVLNNPFWWSADDKFIDNVIAEAVDVAVPRSAILPHKEHPPNTGDDTFRNLNYPIDWDDVFDYIGFPAFLKPYDGGGWRGVTKVTTPGEVFAAYDQSGTDCMMLQEGIEYERYYRCYGVGQDRARIMKYNPAAPSHERYSNVPSEPIPEAERERVERDVIAICRALGYDMNTVEFAVRDGVPYAIDFMNPAPDADYHSVGQANFEWIVRNMAEVLIDRAQHARPTELGPHAPGRLAAHYHQLEGDVADAE